MALGLLAGGCCGRAVQVDSFKPKLKPSGTKRFETKLWSTALKFCFQIQLAPLHRGERAAASARLGGERASGGLRARRRAGQIWIAT